ncbi:MAG: hypothetical protein HYS22_03295 [Deltaproteobacteria bacterium]|nr:hypothetical protein [Deltaproteobacteria bacterium]
MAIPAWLNRPLPSIHPAVGIPLFLGSFWAIARYQLAQDPRNWADAVTHPDDYFRGTRYTPFDIANFRVETDRFKPGEEIGFWDPILNTTAFRYLFTAPPEELVGLNYPRAAEARTGGKTYPTMTEDPNLFFDREWADRMAGAAALSMGFAGWYFNYRKKPGGGKLPHSETAVWTAVFALTYAGARQISDGMGAMRAEQGDDVHYNWTRVMTEQANWSILQSEMALRPHYAIATTWATNKASWWSANIYDRMGQRVARNGAIIPTYERGLTRAASSLGLAADRAGGWAVTRSTSLPGYAGTAARWVGNNMGQGVRSLGRFGAAVGGIAVVGRGIQGASRLAREEYQTDGEFYREAAWTGAGLTVTGFGGHQILRSRRVFVNVRDRLLTLSRTNPEAFAKLAVTALEPGLDEATMKARLAAVTGNPSLITNNEKSFTKLARSPQALTTQVIRFDAQETEAIRQARTGAWRNFGRVVTVGTGIYGGLQAFEAAERLVYQESEDPLQDTLLFGGGAMLALIGAVNLVRRPLGQSFVNFENSFVSRMADGAAIAVASGTRAIPLFLNPPRAMAFGTNLAFTGLSNSTVSTATRLAQGYTQKEVLLAEFFRSWVTPIPATAFDTIYRSATGHIPSTFAIVYATNLPAYQPITIKNQERAAPTMNEGALIREWASASPRKREQLAPRIDHYDRLIHKTNPERSRNEFSAALVSLKEQIERLAAASPSTTRTAFNRIQTHIRILGGELETGRDDASRRRMDESAGGDLLRRLTTRVGQAIWIGGQHPSLDRIEEDLDRIEEALGETDTVTEEAKRLLSETRGQVEIVNGKRTEFFRTAGYIRDVAGLKRLYAFSGTKRHPPK